MGVILAPGAMLIFSVLLQFFIRAAVRRTHPQLAANALYIRRKQKILKIVGSPRICPTHAHGIIP